MDFKEIEKAAMLVFRMFREHPELCPHDYEWERTEENVYGDKVSYYKCSVCGNEYTNYKFKR